MATIENDLSRLSDGEIRKRIEQATKVRNEIEKADSLEIVRAGKADETLARLQSAGDTFKAAKATLARRGAKGSLRAAGTFDSEARRNAQMSEWALDPTPIYERPGRPTAPDPWEPLKKAYWLLRNGLPSPLLPEDMDGVPRLSVEEGQELYDLTLRSVKGAMTASEVPRFNELLEKAADKPVGSIEAQRQFEVERRAQEVEQAAEAREAERQRAVERERWLAEIDAARF